MSVAYMIPIHVREQRLERSVFRGVGSDDN